MRNDWEWWHVNVEVSLDRYSRVIYIYKERKSWPGKRNFLIRVKGRSIERFIIENALEQRPWYLSFQATFLENKSNRFVNLYLLSSYLWKTNSRAAAVWLKYWIFQIVDPNKYLFARLYLWSITPNNNVSIVR